MSLHPHFPTSPYAPLIPEHRWFPADEALRNTAYDKLLPPLVAKVRHEIHAWRGQGYPGASPTSVALLRCWFETDHLLENADGSLSPFEYYFARREAVETVIRLHDVRRARDKFDLLRLRDFFLRGHLFANSPVDLEDAVILRNLSEPEAGKILYDAFKTAINALTIADTGTTRIEDRIRLRHTRPFRTENRPFLAAKKSIFTKTAGEPHSGGFELKFAAFLEAAPDVQAFAKSHLAVGFKLDYARADGDLSNYTPDFIVRDTSGTVWIVETKGREEIDLPQKMARLKQWCADAIAAEENGQRYDFVFVDQKGYATHMPKTFAALVASFVEYKH